MSTPQPPTSLFVTVGSTLFPSLTDIVLSATSLDALVSLGIKTLEVQYGKADLPLYLIAPALSGMSREADKENVGGRGGGRGMAGEAEVDSSGSGTFTWKAGQTGDGSGERGGREMEVVVYRYTDDFEGAIRRCGAVISHAGSGSILTVLRANPPKPLLVIPNTSLMDNHQAQLAQEMSKMGYLMASTPETLVRDLPTFLDPQRISTIHPFPAFDGSRFRGIMDELMGFDDDHL